MQTPQQPVPPSPSNDDDLAAWELQRKQVAAHLAWLDARIAGMRSSKTGSTAPEAPPALHSPEDEQVSPASELVSPEVTPAFAEKPPDFLEGPATEQTIRSARLGCTVLAILAIGGTVFVFFVLPYWIYR